MYICVWGNFAHVYTILPLDIAAVLDGVVYLSYSCYQSNHECLKPEQKLSMCNVAYHFKVNCIVDEFFKRVYTFFRRIYTPTRREGAILQSPCPSVRPSVCLSVHTFVTDISASTGRNDFIFDIWLWHGDLYRVSPFQVYRTSTSCLPCDLQMNEWGYS